MKKLTLLFAVAFAVVGSAMAQMAIPGEVFAGNPSRFNGRKVTIKNVEVVKTDAHGGPSIGGPAGSLTGGLVQLALLVLLQLTHVAHLAVFLKYLYSLRVHLIIRVVSLWLII